MSMNIDSPLEIVLNFEDLNNELKANLRGESR